MTLERRLSDGSDCIELGRRRNGKIDSIYILIEERMGNEMKKTETLCKGTRDIEKGASA